MFLCHQVPNHEGAEAKGMTYSTVVCACRGCGPDDASAHCIHTNTDMRHALLNDSDYTCLPQSETRPGQARPD